MITLQDALAHLCIDYADEQITQKVNRCIKVADAHLKGSLGANYPVDDPRAEELALMVVEDLYSNRGTSEKVSGNVRRLIRDFSQQLRLEMSDVDDI